MMFCQGISLVIVKESIIFVMMLLLAWCFIKAFLLSLSRSLLYLSWCSCWHDVLSRHISCHCQGIYYICHDAPVGMMFYQGISLVIIKESIIFVMMLLFAWCFIKAFLLSLSRNLLYLSWWSCCHDVLSRHFSCHYQGISCNCHDAPVVVMFYQNISHDTVKEYLVIVMMLLLSWCFIEAYLVIVKESLVIVMVHGVLSRHINCHCQGNTFCICHDAPVVMMFYQGISLVIVNNSFVFVMMLLFLWCACCHEVLSRHISCQCQGNAFNCHSEPVVMMFCQDTSLVIVKESLVTVMVLLLSCLIKTYHLSLSRIAF